MTVISIIKTQKNKIIMAGDRRISMDWSQSFDMPGAKIRKDKTGILLGGAGSGNLCTILVNVMDIPPIDTKDIDIYIFHQFKNAFKKALINFGYVDEHRMLKIPQDYEMCGIVVVKGKAYLVDVKCPDEYSDHGNILGGIIEIEPCPIPFAVGCGASTAIPILNYERRKTGYSTKEHLTSAMLEAANTSPGCSPTLDFISE